MTALWENATVRHALTLCDRNRRFLFEVLPDKFPQGRLTHLELLVWERYFEDKKGRDV